MSPLFCVLDENCSVYDPTMELAGITHSSPVCEGCRQRAESMVNVLRYDYVDLSQIIPKPEVRSDVKIARPKPESSPPIAMPAYALRSEIAHLLRTAERELRAFLGETQNYGTILPVREGYAVDSSITYLRPRMGSLAEMPGVMACWDSDDPEDFELDGPRVMLYFGALHRRSRRMCGLDDRTIFMPGHCPACNLTGLRRAESKPETVWCVHCKGAFTGSEYLLAVRGNLVHDGP